MSVQTNQNSLLFAVVLGAASCSSAQAQPGGGYQRSCQNTTVQGDILRSSCKDHGGNFHPTELHGFAQCVGDILNEDRVLRCSKGAPPPSCGYSQRCEQPFVDSQTLLSNYRNPIGGMVAANLPNFRHCVDNIFNADGILHCNRGAQPPESTYSNTCNFSRMDGTTLHSTCKTHAGPMVAATLDNVIACRSTIANCDGRLTYMKDTGAIPPGTYTDSCIGVQVTANSITALCLDRDQRGRRSSIADPGSCRTPIENIAGFLTCAKGSAAPPSGSYHDLCHDVVIKGTWLTASCRHSDGGYRQSTINFANCLALISNNQGVLTCPSSTPPLPPPVRPSSKLICTNETHN